MQRIGRWHFLVLIIWLIATCLSVFTMPSTDQLLREKGQPQPGKEYSSRVASELLEEFSTEKEVDADLVEGLVVFHNPDGLTALQSNEIKKKLQELDTEKLRIHSLFTPFDNKKAEERLFSKDRTTMMVPFSIDKNKKTVSELSSLLSHELEINQVHTYLTGKDFINEDFIQTSIDSVKSTEIVTIFIIIAVLLIVFRSPVTPFISLITVGISYLVSLCIVLHLVEWFNFPFSNTTQIFLILVLFGIGTDYTILLLMRYKEEVLRGEPIRKALSTTYKTAGKTVFFSALAVFIGFSMVGFSQFSIYQSAVAVAIGVIILLLAIFSVVPILIQLFGKSLFWPQRAVGKGESSKLWGWLGHLSIRRSIISLSMILLITLPGIFLYHGKLSFNSIKEIDPHNDSIEGFHAIAKSFGKGETLPTKVVIKAKHPLDTSEGLAWVDFVNQRLLNIPGVSKVYGPTRPLGEQIDSLYLNEQAKELHTGLYKSANGLDKISHGLQTASSRIPSAEERRVSDVDKLVNGTSSIIGSLNKTRDALSAIHSGLKSGADHSTNLVKGAGQLEDSLATISKQTSQLHEGYHQIAQTCQWINQQHALLVQQAAAIERVSLDMEELANSLESNEIGQKMKAKAAALRQQVRQFQDHITQVNDASMSMNNVLKQANTQLNTIAGLLTQMTVGAGKIKKGVHEVSQGMKQGSEGQGMAVDGLSKIQDGLQTVNHGQRGIRDVLTQFSSRLGGLRKGLSKSAQGIDQISTGIGKANSYLDEVSHRSFAPLIVPENVRMKKDFQNMLDMYMSSDRQSVKWQITLDEDPYSRGAVDIAKNIQAVMTSIENENPDIVRAGVGGISSTNYDLHQISMKDFILTFIFMILGIGLVLLLLFRSFWITIATLMSLMIAYFSALGLTEMLFVEGFGNEGLSWTVPFFSFIMIIALGVDYSIFLLMRYVEYRQISPVEAILQAVKHTGKIVISAMIILSGTFAAMYPSGVDTLMQIATVVIIGLLLLVLLLPLLIPLIIQGREKVRELRRRPFKRWIS